MAVSDDLDLRNLILSTSQLNGAGVVDYRKRIFGARPFSLSDDAVETIAKMAFGKDSNNMIHHYTMLSDMPFSSVWLEFDYNTIKTWVQKNNIKNAKAFSDVKSDDRIGYYISRGEKNREISRITIFRKSNIGEVAVEMFHYELNISEKNMLIKSGNPISEIRDIENEVNGSSLCYYSWGYNPNDSFDKIEFKAQYRSGFSFEPMTLFKSRSIGITLSEQRSNLAESIASRTGELRFIVAFLATINHVPLRFVNSRPKGSFRFNGNIKPFMENRTVYIDLPTKRRVSEINKNIIKTTNSIRMRAHKVRGFYRFSDTCHNEKWILRYDTRYNKMRWSIFIESFTRGDASLGYVEHDYKVRAEN